jgi:hypothetical protein
MRFMVFVKNVPEAEGGKLPDKEAFEAMGRFNLEMANAGMVLAADGLQPTSKGARISFSGGKPSVTDGPFTESKELVAGFWIIQAKSKEDAIAWIRTGRLPGRGSQSGTTRRTRYTDRSRERGAQLGVTPIVPAM